MTSMTTYIYVTQSSTVYAKKAISNYLHCHMINIIQHWCCHCVNEFIALVVKNTMLYTSTIVFLSLTPLVCLIIHDDLFQILYFLLFSFRMNTVNNLEKTNPSEIERTYKIRN